MIARKDKNQLALNKSTAICVLGMHRSGTSVITRAINLLGAYLGDQSQLMPGKENNNPDGFWEHIEIVNLHEQILHALSRTWHDTSPMPDKWWKYPEINPYKQSLIKVVQREFTGYPLWAWKDPRTCILFPLWQEVLEELDIDLNCIIVLRNPLDIAASLGHRDGFQKSKSFNLWHLYTISLLYWTKNAKRIIFSFDNLLENWELCLRNVNKYLSVPWPQNDEELKTNISIFLKPTLRHSQSNLKALLEDADVPEPIVYTYKLCLEGEKSSAFLKSDKFINEINRLYNNYVEYYQIMNQVIKQSTLENYFIQIFSPSGSEFYEQNSTKNTVVIDGDFHSYELNIPKKAEWPLRLDPVNFPAYMEIESIEYIKDNTSSPLLFWKDDNGFEGISLGTGLINLGGNKKLCLISMTNDPQIFINGTFNLQNMDSSKIRVLMRVYNQFDYIFCELLYNYLLEKTKQINEQDSRLFELIKQLREKEEQLSRQKEKSKGIILELSKQLGERDWHLSRQEQSIRCISKELEDLKKINIQISSQITSIQSIIIEKNQNIESLRNIIASIQGSLAWRILQIIGIILNKAFPLNTKRRFLYSIAIICIKAVFLKEVSISYKFKENKLYKIALKTRTYLKQNGYTATLRKIAGTIKNKNNRSNLKPLKLPMLNIADTHESELKSIDAKVSVIIPTKNAGDDFKHLLSKLNKQKGISSIEIIVVDSGSTDKTVELAKSFGAKVKQILPEEFTHSYSRNLGAELSIGDYLLFTVQDALPLTDNWLYELMISLKKNNIVAISCIEYPRAESDLFYRLLTWNHYKTFNLDKDRILFLDKDASSHMEIRANAQINDIACLIKRDIFNKFKYSADYGEDLILGYELIKNGYKIGFCSSIKVLHSHNRPPFYFLKRAYVDQRFLAKNFKDVTYPQLQETNSLFAEIIVSYAVLVNTINDLNKLQLPLSVPYLFKSLKEYMLSQKIEGIALEQFKMTYDDKNLCKFIEELILIIKNNSIELSYDAKNAIVYSSLHHLQILEEYMSSIYDVIDDYIFNDFKDCMYKIFSLQIGAHLAFCYMTCAAINKDMSIWETLNNELVRGI